MFKIAYMQGRMAFTGRLYQLIIASSDLLHQLPFMIRMSIKIIVSITFTSDKAFLNILFITETVEHSSKEMNMVYRMGLSKIYRSTKIILVPPKL